MWFFRSIFGGIDSETKRNMVTMETDATVEHDGSSQSIVGSDMASGVGRV